MAETKAKASKNEKIGQVVSTRMSKTIVVEVVRKKSHPFYFRVVSKDKKFYAHDEKNEAHTGDVVRLEETRPLSKRKKFYAHDEEGRAKTGDVVRIIECRPLSKLKRWRLADVIRQAVQVAAQPSDLDVKV